MATTPGICARSCGSFHTFCTVGRVLQLLEELAGDVAELAFLDAIGQLVANRFDRHVSSRELAFAFQNRELLADRDDR